MFNHRHSSGWLKSNDNILIAPHMHIASHNTFNQFVLCGGKMIKLQQKPYPMKSKIKSENKRNSRTWQGSERNWMVLIELVHILKERMDF